MRSLLVLVALLSAAGCHGQQPTGGVGTWGPGDRQRDPHYRSVDDPHSPFYDPLREGGSAAVR